MALRKSYSEALRKGRESHRTCEDAWSAFRLHLKHASEELTEELRFPVVLAVESHMSADGEDCPEGSNSYRIVVRYADNPLRQVSIAQVFVSYTGYPFKFVYGRKLTQQVHRSEDFEGVIAGILSTFQVGKVFNEIVVHVRTGLASEEGLGQRPEGQQSEEST